MRIINLKSDKILKLSLIFIFGLIFCQSLRSQSIIWQRTYLKNSQWIGNASCQTNDGNFVIAGTTVLAGYGPSMMAMKINAFGDTLWTQTLLTSTGTSMEGLAITSTHDGGTVITGVNDSIYVCKLDISGNFSWYKNYPAETRFCYDIKETNDHGLILCGYSVFDPSQAFIFKTDSLGNFQWEKTFTSSFLKIFYSIVLVNSGYILTGIESNFASDRNKLLIININNNGDSIWQKNYYVKNNSTSGHIIIKYGQFLYVGGGTVDSNKAQLMFMKADLNGDSLYVRRFPINGRNEYIMSFNVINDNRVVFGYERDSTFGLSLGAGLISDTLGNIISKKVFTNSSFVWGSLRSVIPINNGDILFSGTAQLQPSFRVVYAVRTDSLLNTPEYIGINSNIEFLPFEFKLYQNYPNPFNPTTSIKYEIPKNAQVTIKVYDLLGKEVFSYSEYKQAGSYEVKFDGSNLASGMYFYSLEANGFKDTKKMVLIK